MVLHFATFAVGLVLLSIPDCETQTVSATYNVATNKIVGPIVQLQCAVHTLPAGSNVAAIRWKFDDKVLATNVPYPWVVFGDRSRHSVTGSADSLQLSIRNAIAKESGTYTCLVKISSGTSMQIMEESVNVSLDSWVPRFPDCIIMSTTVTVGSWIDFGCASNTRSKLNLTLTRIDGTTIAMLSGITNRISHPKMMTSEDNGAIYICYQEYEAFPTAQMSCWAGPILVEPTIETHVTDAGPILVELTTVTPTTSLSNKKHTTSTAVTMKSTHETMVTMIPPSTTPDDHPSPPTTDNCNFPVNCNALIIILPVASGVITFTTILAVVFLLWKNHNLKEKIASNDMKRITSTENAVEVQGVNSLYMELQKTQSQHSEYMNVN